MNTRRRRPTYSYGDSHKFTAMETEPGVFIVWDHHNGEEVGSYADAAAARRKAQMLAQENNS